VRARLAVLGIALSVLACGETTSSVQTATLPARSDAEAPPYPEAPAAWAGYHSLRFAMTIPLPDAGRWKIDDQSRHELVAAEPTTRSSLLVLLEAEPGLVNHALCEERARVLGLFPTKALRTIEDAVTVGPEAFDTHVRVGVEARGAPDGPLVGHVMAAGAYVRKCLFVHLATEVPSAGDDGALSQRLALARVRTLGGITLDELNTVPRDKAR
jgi:hypothetical protein